MVARKSNRVGTSGEPPRGPPERALHELQRTSLREGVTRGAPGRATRASPELRLPQPQRHHISVERKRSNCGSARRDSSASGDRDDCPHPKQCNRPRMAGGRLRSRGAEEARRSDQNSARRLVKLGGSDDSPTGRDYVPTGLSSGYLARVRRGTTGLPESLQLD